MLRSYPCFREQLGVAIIVHRITTTSDTSCMATISALLNLLPSNASSSFAEASAHGSPRSLEKERYIDGIIA